MTVIKNSVCIITGASSGTGKELARHLAKEGAITVLVARTKNKLKELENELNLKGYYAVSFATNITNRKDIRSMVNKVMKRFGRIDILVNNAGIGLFQTVVYSAENDIKAVFNTNFYGTLYCTQEVLKCMKKQRSGLIVNISSAIGKHALYNQGVYAASKAAIERITEAIHAEESDSNIKTLLVIPDRTKTNFLKHSLGPKELARLPHQNLRELEPEKVAQGIIKAIKKNKLVYYTSFRGRAYSILSALAPFIIRRLFKRNDREYFNNR